MKAQEVLRRYADGERNFCNANLRGANFKGQDLSGADFSGADIRSANFTNANLQKTTFTKAQAGLQRRWVALQLLLVIVIAFIAGVLQGFSGTMAALFFDSSIFNTPTEIVAAVIVYLLLTVVVYMAIALQGFTVRAFSSILSAGAGAGLLFSLYVGWRVLKEDEKFDILRGFGLALAALGGTSFAGAALTGATFSQARLKSTNFANSRRSKTNFTHVC